MRAHARSSRTSLPRAVGQGTVTREEGGQLSDPSVSMFDLSSDVAILTGGARGLGRAEAQALASAGASMALVDINLDEAARTADQITSSGGSAHAFQADVTNLGQF